MKSGSKEVNREYTIKLQYVAVNWLGDAEGMMEYASPESKLGLLEAIESLRVIIG